MRGNSCRRFVFRFVQAAGYWAPGTRKIKPARHTTASPIRPEKRHPPMQLHQFYSSLAIRNDNKIVVLLIDGLGGMSHKDYSYKTELEYANHPNLDRLASRGTTGMLTPVLPGVTPGSGPAHIGLF